MNEQPNQPTPQAAPQEPGVPVSQPTPITSPAPQAAAQNETAPPSMAQHFPPAAVATGPTKKILLVEDDDALASVYETRLQAEGFDVRRVPNGEDALASALQYRPDLILLDVMMPKVSGFDVLDILRNTPETTNIKIIMLTALSQDTDRQRAEELGVDDYLVKSQVVIADVVERIKQHLNM